MSTRNARHIAADSPSIALEHGIGQLRPPTQRPHEPSPSPSRLSGRLHKSWPLILTAPKSASRPRQVKLLIAWIVIVAVFIIRAFLVGRSWRWELHHATYKASFAASPNFKKRPIEDKSTHEYLMADHLSPSSAIITRIASASQPVPYSPSSKDRYLTWLPHSGFHNQRVSFENALILAHILNQNLIVPPIRLGKVIRYSEFDKLCRYVSLSTKTGLEHCAHVHLFTSFMPYECISYSDFTMLPWSTLIDIHAVARIVPIVERWDLSSAWLKNYLNISRSEIALLKDSLPYQFQIYDDSMNQRPLKEKYLERLNIEDIQEELGSARLIHLGSLFGTSRLRLKSKLLLDISRCISDSLSGPYYHGLHLRLGDGEFETLSESNVRLVWWLLVAGLMGLSFDDACEVEARAMRWNASSRGEWPAPPSPLIEPSEDPSTAVHPNMIPLPPANTTDTGFPTSGSSVLCPQHLHSISSNLTRLSFPVYIATDATSPRANPSLNLFLRTLPCVFFLSDFGAQLHVLEAVKNEDDGLPLKPFLLPFIDSVVAAMASRVIEPFLNTPSCVFGSNSELFLRQEFGQLLDEGMTAKEQKELDEAEAVCRGFVAWDPNKWKEDGEDVKEILGNILAMGDGV
ncbi:hypothetical protein DL93DRAFT_2173265 [Clavulina sp. PMI_390]|nr:hypothetical protein DL93DRAFT_2173265 [Clavulina sp. PMI_390]